MSSQEIASSWDASRAARREDAARYATTFFVSVLLHLLLVLLAIWLGFRAPEEVEEEIEVPIVFEEPAPLEPPPPQAQPQPQPQPQPPPQEEQQQEEIPEDVSLLGFSSSEGEIEARPTRPQGPEDDSVKAPPAPVETEAPEEIRPLETEPEPEPLEDAQEAEEELELPDEGDPSDAFEPPEPNAAPETLPPVSRDNPEFGDAPETDRQNERAPRAGSESLPFPPIPERRPPPRRPSRRPDERRRVPDFNVDVTGSLWADNIKFDSKDYNWEEYSTKLYFAVYRAWLRELLGRVRRFERDQVLNDLLLIEGQASIRFTILRDGSANGVVVVDPSVIPTLDEASRAAIERAVIPPLPSDFPRDSEGVTFRFIISGFETATQIERQLKYLQYRGEF